MSPVNAVVHFFSLFIPEIFAEILKATVRQNGNDDTFFQLLRYTNRRRHGRPRFSCGRFADPVGDAGLGIAFLGRSVRP